VLVVDHNQNKIIVRIEVINEYKGSYIDIKRARRIRSNLRGTKAKLLILSFKTTISQPEVKRTLRNITKIYLGYQELPSEFYLFFKRNYPDTLRFRKIANKSTLHKLKEQILGFLYAKHSDLLMYIKGIKLRKYMSMYNLDDQKLKELKLKKHISMHNLNNQKLRMMVTQKAETDQDESETPLEEMKEIMRLKNEIDKWKILNEYKKSYKYYGLYSLKYALEKIIEESRYVKIELAMDNHVQVSLTDNKKEALQRFNNEREENRRRLRRLRLKRLALRRLIDSKERQINYLSH